MLLLIALLIAAAPSETEDRWTVMKGRDAAGLVAVVVRVRLDKPKRADIGDFKWLIQVRLPYPGKYPDAAAKKRIADVEARRLAKVPDAVLVADKTGDGVQDWSFYAKNAKAFEAWAKAERSAKVDVTIQSEEDPGWQFWTALLALEDRSPL